MTVFPLKKCTIEFHVAEIQVETMIFYTVVKTEDDLGLVIFELPHQSRGRKSSRGCLCKNRASIIVLDEKRTLGSAIGGLIWCQVLDNRKDK